MSSVMCHLSPTYSIMPLKSLLPPLISKDILNQAVFLNQKIGQKLRQYCWIVFFPSARDLSRGSPTNRASPSALKVRHHTITSVNW